MGQQWFSFFSLLVSLVLLLPSVLALPSEHRKHSSSSDDLMINVMIIDLTYDLLAMIVDQIGNMIAC